MFGFLEISPSIVKGVISEDLSISFKNIKIYKSLLHVFYYLPKKSLIKNLTVWFTKNAEYTVTPRVGCIICWLDNLSHLLHFSVPKISVNHIIVS